MGAWEKDLCHSGRDTGAIRNPFRFVIANRYQGEAIPDLKKRWIRNTIGAKLRFFIPVNATDLNAKFAKDAMGKLESFVKEQIPSSAVKAVSRPLATLLAWLAKAAKKSAD